MWCLGNPSGTTLLSFLLKPLIKSIRKRGISPIAATMSRQQANPFPHGLFIFRSYFRLEPTGFLAQVRREPLIQGGLCYLRFHRGTSLSNIAFHTERLAPHFPPTIPLPAFPQLDRTVILSNGAPLTGQLTEHCWMDYDCLLSILDPMTAPRTIATTTINPSNNQIAITPAPIASLKAIGRDLYNITNLSNITV